MTDQQMPVNLDAERAVLGSLLIPGTGAYDRVVAIVSGEDFRDPRHKAIYAAITALDGRGVDLLTVKAKLSAGGALESAGGVVYLSSLTDVIPDIANVERYARLVKDAALRRGAIVECQRLQAAAFSGEAISEIAANGAMLFSDLAATHDSGPMAIRDIGRRTMTRLEERIASGSWMTGIPTGLGSLDQSTLGLQRGVLSVFGARPRVGKTATALSMSLHAIKTGHRVLFVQLDMSEGMLGDRILAAVSGVPLFKIRTGKGMSGDEMAQAAKASADIARMGDSLLFEYRARDIAKIAAYVRRAARNGGLDLLIVDHIGHVRGGRGEKRYLEIGDVSSRLIELAGDTNAAALALVQLGRDAEQRSPGLSDLRESGNLEQDARLVVLLDRPILRAETRPTGEEYPECEMSVLVPKNEGETGASITAHFDLRLQRITQEPEGPCQFCGGPQQAPREWRQQEVYA